MSKFGYCEGETCGRKGCKGIVKEQPVENCSCHSAPPCGACTSPRGFCEACADPSAYVAVTNASVDYLKSQGYTVNFIPFKEL
jgi:hypothetical protein